MIDPVYIGCLQPPDFPAGGALVACLHRAAEQLRPAFEIQRDGNALIARLRVAGGNNNGNGNVGNGNGNGNTGSNNGNFNIGDGNGNCFASDNNQNNNHYYNSWDYEEIMKRLKRCNMLPYHIPQ